MRSIIWTLLLVTIAVGLAMLLKVNHGNVSILWPPYRVDVSINLALLVILGVFVIAHLLLVGLATALRLPERVREYRLRRDREEAAFALRDSVLALFEGRFGRAERLAQNARQDPSFAGSAALIAARAAHRLREPERRDKWLDAVDTEPAALHAQLVTRAELAMEDRDAHAAIEAVRDLHSRGARHIHSLRIALRAYEASEDWDQMLATLRQLEKRDALHPSAIRGLKTRACRALFARRTGEPARLKELLSGLRGDERTLPEIAEAAALAFARSGDAAQAQRLLEAAIDQQIAPRLLQAYAGLDDVSLRDRIARVEQWRERYGEEPALLLALGRLCAAQALWGKAEEYLRHCLRLEPQPEAHVVLAEAYEAMGRTDEAAEHFQAAARLAVQGSLGDTLPRRPRALPAPA